MTHDLLSDTFQSFLMDVQTQASENKKSRTIDKTKNPTDVAAPVGNFALYSSAIMPNILC